MASSFSEEGGDEYDLGILTDDDINTLCYLLEQKDTLSISNDSSRAANPQSSGQQAPLYKQSISPSSSLSSEQTPTRLPPIIRFRTKPKKPLSVTDLVSGAWCEIQYEFTLETYGRKPSNSAMRRGTELHKTLEQSLHDSVDIEIASKEEAWALRLYNSIVRLRTLEAEGIAREFEVWGIIKGQVVHGVIDELTAVRPDEASELAAVSTPTHQSGSIEDAHTSFADRTIYICDVKSRKSKRLPNDVSFRPTFLQLSLYRRLLVSMVEDDVKMEEIFDRYGLDYDQPLSDRFVEQMTSAEVHGHDHARNGDSAVAGPIVTLSALWSELIRRLQHNMPNGGRSVGATLKAEYRDQDDGEVFGVKIFDYNPDVVESYVESQMAFWTGDREAAGPPVEEAFKCSFCEFAEGCEWRQSQHLRRSRGDVQNAPDNLRPVE